MDGDRRIVTHGDFDGIVSAALVSSAWGIETMVFTGPTAVSRAEISIGPADIVCDLPYPLECGMWFDHHAGNLEAVIARGIDPDGIPGRFETSPSCARVVLDHMGDAGIETPPYLGDTVEEADVIDSFAYTSVEEWRSQTPGKLVDLSMKARFSSYRERTAYLERLARMIRDVPLPEVAADPEVARRVDMYGQEEDRMLEILRGSSGFLDEDSGRELVVIDFTGHNRKPRVMRNLSYVLFPEALGSLLVDSVHRGGRKTNDLSVSLSLSMNMTGKDHGKDAGEIMRRLGIGDGHPGAAAGRLHCGSKEEMLKDKKRLLSSIWAMWKEMPG